MAIVSCCYVLLLKTSSKSHSEDRDEHKEPKLSFDGIKNTKTSKHLESKDEIQILPQSAPPITEEYIEKSVPVATTSVKKIEKLPLIGAPSMDPNRTLNWLDLWSNDTFCNQFTVHLLEENLQPRALVSFPGSGNTWLRMLLMGVTGLYVDTIYPGDEFFSSKGIVHFKEQRIRKIISIHLLFFFFNFLFLSLLSAGGSYELKKDCNCSLLQKTHDLSLFSVIYNMALTNKSSEKRLNQEVEHFHGDGILVIRNPFKAILSYRNFAFGGNMAGLAPVEAFSQGLEPIMIGERRISSELIQLTNMLQIIDCV